MQIDKADVEILVMGAREMARAEGPFVSADDSSITGLALAHANWELLKGHWCQCQPQGEPVYFANKDTGSHGWMCLKCRGIQQTG